MARLPLIRTVDLFNQVRSQLVAGLVQVAAVPRQRQIPAEDEQSQRHQNQTEVDFSLCEGPVTKEQPRAGSSQAEKDLDLGTRAAKTLQAEPGRTPGEG